jgi:hypothetical protein
VQLVPRDINHSSRITSNNLTAVPISIFPRHS